MTVPNLEQLNSFVIAAAGVASANGSKQASPWKRGFQELEYKERDWYYRDSYCGYFRSWGQEAVWHNNRPVWVQDYGGGMEDRYVGNATFAQRTFVFLQKALAVKPQNNVFQPRGPNEFKLGDWRYETTVQGDIKKFEGRERIFYKDNLVFTHRYFGGVVPSREVGHVGTRTY